MGTVSYQIAPHAEGWVVEHEGMAAGPYVTKEAALEAAVGPASNAIKEGHDVLIMVPGRGRAGDNALGT